MKKSKKGLGVPRPKKVGSVSASKSSAKKRPGLPATPSRKETLPRLSPGDICRMEALSGFNYWWIGKYARIEKCFSSMHTGSGLAVNFQPIGWEIEGNGYAAWDRAWFTLVLPALGIRKAATKERVPASRGTGAKRSLKKPGRKATPKQKK